MFEFDEADYGYDSFASHVQGDESDSDNGEFDGFDYGPCDDDRWVNGGGEDW